MCGIAGIVQINGGPVEPQTLQQMTARLAHRGPDGSGTCFNGNVGLGSRRLAIIDPAGGGQPFESDDGSAAVTFNGAIYNYRELRRELAGLGHRFRTDSDTEVLLHAWRQWGPQCVLRLRGMFAFAAFDRDKQEFFLARDRFGIKPLVYTVHDGALYFASELQAFPHELLRSREIDFKALDQYLYLGYIPAPNSIYRNVYKLSPGHCITLRLDRSKVPEPDCYWYPRFEPQPGISPHEWLEALDAVLDESVQAHTISDVPYGVLLSGGIDSTLIASCLAAYQPNCACFSVGFQDPELDESDHATHAAGVLGLKHVLEQVPTDTFSLLPRLAQHYGEPFADWSAVPTYQLAQIASRHVPMVLSGDGGDELFAGYNAYADLLQNGHNWDRCMIRCMDSSRRYALWRQEYHPVVADDLAAIAALAPVTRRSPDTKSLTFARACDLATYLPGSILTKVDIAAMTHGLEVRTPYLDLEVFRVAAQIPAELLVSRNEANNFRLKTMLKDLLAKRHPGLAKSFIERRKMGFIPPIKARLVQGGADRAAAESLLLSKYAKIRDYFEPQGIKNIFAMLDQDGDCGPLWAILFLETWLNERQALAG